MKRKDDLTKIVCTIGPASEKREVLEAMIKAGMDVARLNFSHGSHDSHFQAILNLRHAAYRTGKSIGIMADIQGPRIRISELQDKKTRVSELLLEKGERILLKEAPPSKTLPGYLEKHIRLDSHVPLIHYLEKGAAVFLDSGLIELRARIPRFEGGWEMEVRNSEKIKVRKGVNFPTLAKYIPSFTSKDKSDLAFALRQGVDFVALSFVKSSKDITDLKGRMQKMLGRKKGLPSIVAKIETVAAISNIKEILEAADAIMVARGDLAVEARQEKVPLYQKLLVRHCIKKGLPVIVATNMLESMVELPRPTRAELADVANAVIDHTDAAMLSGESANGKYPVRSVQTMSRIIRATEQSRYDEDNDIPELEKKRRHPAKNLAGLTAQTIYNLALEGKPKAIVIKNVPVPFIAGLSNLRPPVPILCFLGNHNPWARKLIIYFGVVPFPSETRFRRTISRIHNYIQVEGKKGKNGWEFSVKLKQEKTTQKKR